jgi:hypothetical protein
MTGIQVIWLACTINSRRTVWVSRPEIINSRRTVWVSRPEITKVRRARELRSRARLAWVISRGHRSRVSSEAARGLGARARAQDLRRRSSARARAPSPSAAEAANSRSYARRPTNEVTVCLCL